MGRFEYAFRLRVDEILKRAKEAQISQGTLCHTAGVSSGTLQVWKRRCPHTIESVDKLEAALEKLLDPAWLEKQRKLHDDD